MPCLGPVATRGRAKFECQFSRQTTRLSSGELDLSLERVSDYYEILAVPCDVTAEQLMSKLMAEMERYLGNMTHGTRSAYLEAAVVLALMRAEYDTYRSLVPGLEELMMAAGMFALPADARGRLDAAEQNLLGIQRRVLAVQLRHQVPVQFLRQVQSALTLCRDLRRLLVADEDSTPVANPQSHSTNPGAH